MPALGGWVMAATMTELFRRMAYLIEWGIRSRRALSTAVVLAASVGCSAEDALIMPGGGEPAGSEPTGSGSAGVDGSSGGSGGSSPDGSPVGGASGAGPTANGGAPGGAGNTSTGGVNGLPQEQQWGTPPELLARVSLDDEALGQQALAVLGSSAVGASGSCSSCHALGRPTLTRWQQLTQAFASACLGNTALPDQAAVDATLGCFGSHASGSAGFAPADFGIYAAAAHLPWFSFVLSHSAPTAAEGADEHAQFVARVGMPRAGAPLTQEQFNLVAEWFTRGLPGLFQLVPEDSGEGCTPFIDARLPTHVAEMATSGWAARNAEVPLLMYGCDGGAIGAGCLQNVPAAATQSFGAGWDVVPGTTVRILWDNSAAPTTYWSRSSPDGRFIASGRSSPDADGHSGQVVDLERNVAIPGNFAYDATFFPDNTGFMAQRGQYAPAPPGGLPTSGEPGAGDVAITCEQSLLLAGPAEITGDEAQCTSLTGQIGLYEQLSRSLDGDDYWVVYGAYGEDDGGFHPVFDNPAAAFETRSTTSLLPMINQGNGYEPGPAAQVQTPLQGDPMLSPSGKLLITRVKGEEKTVNVDGIDIVTAEQSGYALHFLTTAYDGTTASASVEQVARICINGSKPTLSYDERWMVIHHYVTAEDAEELGFADASDPAFAAYLESGASNIYLIDLLNGESRRITNVRPGQYALFPHFRSDGWVYFVVRTLEADEYFAASDAAFVVGAAD
jgi:hypothetical protein